MGKFESSMKMAVKMRHGIPTVFLLFIMVSIGEVIWLDVPPTRTKCVSEEIQSNVVVLADYIIISEDHSAAPTISAKFQLFGGSGAISYYSPSDVTDSPYGNNLHHSDNVTHGEFTFTTKESGNYIACFWADAKSHGNKNVSINVEWKTGIAAKDWASIAKKEKLEGVELEIRKLEVAVEAIHENLIYLRNKEADMRTVSEKTNSRVAWCSMMSLGICIVVSGLQVVYLKHYFEKKKLI